jgi:hypothetical protein
MAADLANGHIEASDRVFAIPIGVLCSEHQ